MSAYMNLTMILIGFIGVSTIPEAWVQLPLSAYGLILIISIGVVVTQITRLMAIKHLTTNRMSVFMQIGLML